MNQPTYHNHIEYFFEYLLPKFWLVFAKTPLGVIAGVTGGWAYIGYFLLNNREKLPINRIIGGWMLSVFVGWVSYQFLEVYMVGPGFMTAKIALPIAMLMGSTGSTGYKELVRHAQKLFPNKAGD